MQATDVIKEIRELAATKDSPAMLHLSAELESLVTNWVQKRSAAQQDLHKMRKTVQRLKDALASVSSLLLDQNIDCPEFAKVLDTELTRVVDVAEELVRWPESPGVRKGRISGSIKDQVQEAFGFWFHKLDIRVPNDLPALNVNLSELYYPSFSKLISALMPSVYDSLQGPGLTVSAAMTNLHGQNHIELVLREASDLKVVVHPEPFSFPLGDIDAVPDSLAPRLIEADCLVRKMGGRLSVTSAPGKGAEIILRFPANPHI